MRQGVYDSYVLVLFLANATLSRYFCLKEIGWALEFGKPIVIFVEQDDRIWPWDLKRWVNDECERVPGSQSTWTKGWLQNTYAAIQQQHPAVVAMIESHHLQGRMLPFRRREFEVLAMIQEVFQRVEPFVCWRQAIQRQSVSNFAANQIANPKVFIVAATSLPSISSLVEDLKTELHELSPNIQWADLHSATHALVLLTDGILDDCASDLRVVAAQLAMRTVFIYSLAHGWNFSSFYSRPDDDVKHFIASNEALPLRALPYERRALLCEALKRIND